MRGGDEASVLDRYLRGQGNVMILAMNSQHIGPEHIALESKIILQKNFGPIVVAYNAILEAEWEGEEAGVYDEQKGVFEQTFGVSYQFNPYFLVGGELLHEIEFPEWSDVNDSIVYIGPNASFRYTQFSSSNSPFGDVVDS